MERYQEAVAICKVLNKEGYPTRMVGGCVRDRLMGLDPKDFDLATTARPELVRDLFHSRGYRIIPVGLAHGTVSLITPNQHLEITTLRIDVACDGRRAEVAFSADFAEDAKRRDFTINALFEDADGHIHDAVGGQADLKAQILRFVGDAESRIREDYLRILRYFRFLARLGWQARPEELDAIQKNLGGLNHLSAERILKELDLLLVAPHSSMALEAMARCGVLSTLFPWFRLQHVGDLAWALNRLQGLGPEWSWFVFFYLGMGPWNQVDWHPLMQEMRFAKKTIGMLASLNTVVNDPGSDLPRLAQLLTLKQKWEPGLDNLLQGLDLVAPLLKPGPDSVSRQLLEGMRHLPVPTIPSAPLLDHPAPQRGRIVDLARICWYLGIIHDTKDLMEVVSKPDRFFLKFNDSDPKQGRTA